MAQQFPPAKTWPLNPHCSGSDGEKILSQMLSDMLLLAFTRGSSSALMDVHQLPCVHTHTFSGVTFLGGFSQVELKSEHLFRYSGHSVS